MDLKPATKKTLTESVIEQIAGQIYRGELAPGAALPSERQLGEMLRVGRTTIREALRALETLRLVEIRPGHGAYVASTSNGGADVALVGAALARQSRLHLAEARKIIEAEVAALAAARRTPEEAVALLRLLQQMEAAGRERRLDDEVAVHTRFHTAIAEMGRNPVLAHVVATILQLLPATSLGNAPAAGASERAQELHQRIYTCIERGDVDGAREAMRAHMALEEDVIAQAYRAGQGAPGPRAEQ